jgi:hypothetical protein
LKPFLDLHYQDLPRLHSLFNAIPI